MSKRKPIMSEHVEEDPVSEALDKLDTNRYTVEQGIIKPIGDVEMTREEWNAIIYLLDEWTFLYEPEADLTQAAIRFEREDEEKELIYF